MLVCARLALKPVEESFECEGISKSIVLVLAHAHAHVNGLFLARSGEDK